MWQNQLVSPEEIWFSLALHMLDKHYYPGKLLSGFVSMQIHLPGLPSWFPWLGFKAEYECSFCNSFSYRCVAAWQNVIISWLWKLFSPDLNRTPSQTPMPLADKMPLWRLYKWLRKVTRMFVLAYARSHSPYFSACLLLFCIYPQQQKYVRIKPSVKHSSETVSERWDSGRNWISLSYT